jgi:hypothetical protein
MHPAESAAKEKEEEEEEEEGITSKIYGTIYM